MEITIRPYTEPDFDTVTNIWFTSWESVGLGLRQPSLQAELRERLPREIEGGWSVFVATVDSNVVGFLALQEEKLQQLFVSPGMQGRGIGKELLDFAKSKLPKGFYLTTPTANRACHFYEREGLSRGETGAHPELGFPIVRYDWRPSI